MDEGGYEERGINRKDGRVNFFYFLRLINIGKGEKGFQGMRIGETREKKEY